MLAAGETRAIDFKMSKTAISVDAIEVFATMAAEETTPVAFTTIGKAQLQNQLGSRDLPLALNMTPSTYATAAGGGAGDSRISVRGFSQRNTAVMVNGVPVNDMENGWVYWSNWDGLGEAATSIQLQRGLSAVNLAIPSIGGTLNIITDPTAPAFGFSYKQEFGFGGTEPDGSWTPNRNLLKETFVLNSGRIGKFGLTASGVRKTGAGMYEGFFGGEATWTDAWSYYVAAAYEINDRNRMEFYAVGAPQQHGQNVFALNIGSLSHDFARSLEDYDPAALARFAENPRGRTGSPNVHPVSSSYGGLQYASTGPNRGLKPRHDPNYINERENYFHRPQINLNWYSKLSDGLTLATVAYHSGGDGGGTGTYGAGGNAVFRYDHGQRVPDWDATIAKNRARADGSSGFILRNSVNNQWTIGAISKLRKEFSGGWSGEAGIDWRRAEIEHYREVRDLLGGRYYVDGGSAFWSESESRRGLGDKIHYHNTNRVDWIGMHVQGERSTPHGSIFGMFGLARNSYALTDHFKRAAPGSSRELGLESGELSGFQVKGGIQRNVTHAWSVFGNAGYVSKVPVYDVVIDDIRSVVNADPKNESFLLLRGGGPLRSTDRRTSFDVSLYSTTWKDRSYNVFVRNIDGEGNDGLVNLLGVDARHLGAEAQAAYLPHELLRLDIAASVGNWKYIDDVTGQYASDDRRTVERYAFHIENLKVGDAPQMQFAYSASIFPSAGLHLQAAGRTYANHYAGFSPFSRRSPNDRKQSWKAPGYTVFDLHLSYRMNDIVPVWKGGDFRVFANVFNLFDTVYVQDATDNSRFNGWDGDHDADDAEVFLGYPRNLHIGLQIGF